MAFEDRYPVDQSGPATRGQAVTPSDSVSVGTCRALWVGGAGNVAVTTVHGDTFTLVGVQAGTLIPVRANLVKSTGTTATSIVALW